MTDTLLLVSVKGTRRFELKNIPSVGKMISPDTIYEVRTPTNEVLTVIKVHFGVQVEVYFEYFF